MSGIEDSRGSFSLLCQKDIKVHNHLQKIYRVSVWHHCNVPLGEQSTLTTQKDRGLQILVINKNGL